MVSSSPHRRFGRRASGGELQFADGDSYFAEDKVLPGSSFDFEPSALVNSVFARIRLIRKRGIGSF